MTDQKDTDRSMSPARRSWRRFRKNRSALFGVVIIGLALMVSILGGTIRPDGAPHANTQDVSLAMKGINFSVEMIKVRINAPKPDTPWWSQLFFGGRKSDYRDVSVHDVRIEGGYLVGHEYGGGEDRPGLPFKISLADVVYPIEEGSVVFTGDSIRFQTIDGKFHTESVDKLQNTVARSHIKTKKFLLGTDKFGRDMLSRLMAGTIISLSVGAISVFISLVLGIFLGSVAGYYGGRVDHFITWLINVVWSIPTLLLVIAITFALGKGFVQVFIAVG